MFTIIAVVIIIVCIFLAFVVLVQNPKGGGVNATFGGVSNQVFGANRSTDFIEKATWGLAITLLVLCIGSTFFIEKAPVAKDASIETAPAAVSTEKSVLEDKVKGMMTLPQTQTAPAAPAPAQNEAPAAAPAQK